MAQSIRHFQQILAEALDAKDFSVADLLIKSVSHILAVCQSSLVLIQQLSVLLLGSGQVLGQFLHFRRRRTSCGFLFRRLASCLLRLLFCGVQPLTRKTQGAVDIQIIIRNNISEPDYL